MHFRHLGEHSYTDAHGGLPGVNGSLGVSHGDDLFVMFKFKGVDLNDKVRTNKCILISCFLFSPLIFWVSFCGSTATTLVILQGTDTGTTSIPLQLLTSVFSVLFLYLYIS